MFAPAALVVAGSLHECSLTSRGWDLVGLVSRRRAVADEVFWRAPRNNLPSVVGSIVLQAGMETVPAAMLDRGVTVRRLLMRPSSSRPW